MISIFIAAYLGTSLAILSSAWLISHKSKADRERQKIDDSVSQLQRAEITNLQKQTVLIMKENQAHMKRIADAICERTKAT